MRLLLVLVLSSVLPLAGCSFIFVDGPSSSRPGMVYPSCDEERTMPAIDLVLAALYGVGGLVGATAEDNDDFDGNDDRAGTITGMLLGVALFGGSAWYGFSKTGSCREARDQYRKQYGDPRLQPLPPPMPYAYPAGEGQQCHPQAGCQPGLVCASGLCVRFQQPQSRPPGTQPPPPAQPPQPPPPSTAPPPPPPAAPPPAAPWPPPPKTP